MVLCARPGLSSHEWWWGRWRVYGGGSCLDWLCLKGSGDSSDGQEDKVQGTAWARLGSVGRPEEEKWSLMGNDRCDARMHQGTWGWKGVGWGRIVGPLNCCLFTWEGFETWSGLWLGSDSIRSGLLRRESKGREVVKIVYMRDDKGLPLGFRRQY